MGKIKFKRNTMTSREMRRMGEREINRERNERALQAFWALSPEERAQKIADNEAFQRISKNGITLEDMHNAESEAYIRGVNDGKNATVKTCFAAICMALHETHGFDKEQCSDMLNDVYDRLRFALTTEDAIQEVYDAIGLEITFTEDITGDVVSVKGA